ncbi:MAG: Bax inhibitor-1/YccA family protein [Chitinophagales bacterium]
MFASSNPILNKKSFYTAPADREKTFSLSGSLHLAMLLLSFIALVAASSWYVSINFQSIPNYFLSLSAMLAVITGYVIRFKRSLAFPLSYVYGLFKGVFIGLISAKYNQLYHGIVIQAVALSFLVFMLMLFLYRFKLIVLTKRLRSIIISATSAIVLVYLLSFLLYILDLPRIPYIHENGWIGILFSVFVSLTAAFHLLLNFDFIERAQKYKYPSYMEAYAAFGLIVSLVWQYLSILRLLKKTKN